MKAAVQLRNVRFHIQVGQATATLLCLGVVWSGLGFSHSRLGGSDHAQKARAHHGRARVSPRSAPPHAAGPGPGSCNPHCVVPAARPPAPQHRQLRLQDPPGDGGQWLQEAERQGRGAPLALLVRPWPTAGCLPWHRPLGGGAWRALPPCTDRQAMPLFSTRSAVTAPRKANTMSDLAAAGRLCVPCRYEYCHDHCYHGDTCSV